MTRATGVLRAGVLRAGVLAGLLALGACSAGSGKGGDFTLTDQHNASWSLSQERGKVVMLFFGYTMCPDVCPTTLSKLSRVTSKLGADRARVRTVYVSVDPERDTPAVLKADLDLFDLDAVGLTGTRQAIDQVVKQYGASYEITPTPESAAKYSVSHSTTLYLIDGTGALRTELPYEATVDEVLAAVKELLKP